MITDRIKALFSFIDFLHSNIDNFKQFDCTIDELYLLNKERNKLEYKNNYKDKTQYDKVQNELEQKCNIIDKNIIQLIKLNATEYNICDWKKLETIWNYNISEIRNLKENFNNKDVDIILIQKQKYIEFREKTVHGYLNDLFFDNLDRILKELFGFFNETDKNEFEAFETKTIKVPAIPKSQNENYKPKVENSISKEQLFEMQNKLIPKVDISDVFSHFDTLTKTTNKNDEFHLTNEQLKVFIKASFIDLNPIKQTFNCNGFIKKTLRKVFYDFYFKNKNKETNQTSIKRKYFNILNDAFNGFKENDYTDFSK